MLLQCSCAYQMRSSDSVKLEDSPSNDLLLIILVSRCRSGQEEATLNFVMYLNTGNEQTFVQIFPLLMPYFNHLFCQQTSFLLCLFCCLCLQLSFHTLLDVFTILKSWNG